MSDIVENKADSVIPDVNELIKNPDFIKNLQPIIDSQVSKGVEAYKEKGFKSAVEKEVELRLKAQTTKTPEQLKFDEYESKLAEMQQKIQQKELAELKLKNRELARSEFKDLPEDLLDFFVSEDTELTKKNAEKIKTVLENYKTEIKKQILAGNNITVPGHQAESNLKDPGPNGTKEQWKEYYKNKK